MSGPVVEHEHINRRSIVNNGVVSITYCEECGQWWENIEGVMVLGTDARQYSRADMVKLVEELGAK